tara:strand:+ start:1237 stop:2421 length:1185 start_codon:yes stop_codon:yes gene_type:complete
MYPNVIRPSICIFLCIIISSFYFLACSDNNQKNSNPATQVNNTMILSPTPTLATTTLPKATTVASPTLAPTTTTAAAPTPIPGVDFPTPPPTALPATTVTPTPTEKVNVPSLPTDCSGGFLIELDGFSIPGQPTVNLDVECNETTRTVSSNGVISFDFVPITPNGLSAQDYLVHLDRNPQLLKQHGAMGLGMIGIAIDGVAIFGAFESPRDGYRDPKNDGLLDYCNGHTARGGQYHYHAIPKCLIDVKIPGTLVGYALDGFPIIVPYAYDAQGKVINVRSSYRYIGRNGSINAFEDWEYSEGYGDLNECNAMQLEDGSWAYFATHEFPWMAFCFIGDTSISTGPFTGDAPQNTGVQQRPPPRRGARIPVNQTSASANISSFFCNILSSIELRSQ